MVKEQQWILDHEAEAKARGPAYRTQYAGGSALWPLNDRTDNRALGLVLWQLMRVGFVDPATLNAQVLLRMDFGDENARKPWGPLLRPYHEDIFDEEAMYSEPLSDLVKMCFAFQQNDRPDYIELKSSTARVLKKAKKIFGYVEEGVRGPADLMEHVRVQFPEEL
jgi:hypothetical protein